jgi:hypothetical protein
MVGIALEAPYATLGAVLIWFCIGIVGMCAIHFIARTVVASFDALFFGDRWKKRTKPYAKHAACQVDAEASGNAEGCSTLTLGEWFA